MCIRDSSWVPDNDGHLQIPQLILFESLCWQENPFLLSKIRFKPPILDQLAKEAGIEPGILDLLKKRGITSEAKLRELLGFEGDVSDNDLAGDVGDALEALGITKPPTQGAADPTASDSPPVGGSGGRHSGAGSTAAGTSSRRRGPGSTGGRPFISYVAVHPVDEDLDLDGLDQVARIALEEKAIELILNVEPAWRRTPTNNPGFDLYPGEQQGSVTRWCEVKAMAGRHSGRPVSLSHAQFDWAREHGEAYWLYVVERAGTDEASLVRIKNPAGRASTFTFDHGWLDIAEVDHESGRED